MCRHVVFIRHLRRFLCRLLHVSDHMKMRPSVLLPVFIAVVSLVLAAASALHVSFLQRPGYESLSFIEQQYINRANFNQQQLVTLDRRLKLVSGSEIYLSETHRRLVWLSCIGFSSIAVLSVVSAVLSARAVKANDR